MKENYDYLRTEAFGWCKGKEIEESKKEEKKGNGWLAFLALLIFAIIIENILNYKFGIVFN